jgi:hypothetical protein
MGERRDVYRVLVRKPKRKRPHGKFKRRWEDNIKMDIQEVELGGGGRMDCIDLAKDTDRWRVILNAVLNIGFHKIWGISYNNIY